jgi:hypothetical protein
LVERLKKVSFPVKFAGQPVSWVYLFVAISWNFWCFPFCNLGFGEDTDAWLMAQTVQKLKSGLPYDPARSFGNPLYEYLTSLFPFYKSGFYTNVFNLAFANFFLFRLSAYFPNLASGSLFLLRLGLMAMPFFQEAATSSMEYILTWIFFFESRRFFEVKSPYFFFLGLLICSFLRVEFFIFLSVLFFQKGFNKLILNFLWISCLCLVSFYIGWAWGKNPSPFSDFESAFWFYGGRLSFLLRQSGLLFPVFVLPVLGLFRIKKWKTIPADLKVTLGFFLLLPFEWAYFFPAWVLTIGLLLEKIEFNLLYFCFPVFIFLLGLICISPFSFGFPSTFLKRKEQLAWINWAETKNPKQNEILLYGATYIPFEIEKWIKTLDNRIFQKKGSHLFVGEKLTDLELDSLSRNGFKILISKYDSIRFSKKNLPFRVVEP